MFAKLFVSRKTHPIAATLYASAVNQARLPIFYQDYGVPDTFDGRFEMISLHTYLVLRRLQMPGSETKALSQALFDTLFADMDRSFREMGVGDLGVGKRVKAMARAFYGRVSAYDEGLVGKQGAMEAALRRNLYGTTSPTDEQLVNMEAYFRREAARIDTCSIDDLEAGAVSFGTPQGGQE